MTTALFMAAGQSIRPTVEPLEGWVASAREGDREALEFFLEAIDQRVYTFAWRLLGDRALAEDAAQEAMLKICRSLHMYTPGTNLWGWIYRLVVNQAHDLRRVRDAHPPAEVPADAAAPSFDPARDEQLRRVVDAMGVLTGKERDALVLIDVEGFTSREAAAILGCLSITARTRAAQARRKVRRELVRYYPELKEST